MLTTGHSVHRSVNNLQKFVDAVKVGIACLFLSAVYIANLVLGLPGFLLLVVVCGRVGRVCELGLVCSHMYHSRQWSHTMRDIVMS